MRQDMVLAWPAWGLWGVLWLLRKLLHGLYIAIFYLNMGRSREMEATYDPRYQGMYDHRHLMPGDIQAAVETARTLPREFAALAQEHAGLYSALVKHEGDVYGALDFLNNTVGTSLSYDDFQDLLAIFREAHQELKDALDNAEGMIIPDLKNMPAGEKLRPFLLPKKLIAKLRRGSSSLESQWLEKFMRQYTEVQKRINRLHFKSVGGILALQEQIGAEALRRVGAGNLPVHEARKPPPLPAM
jgi:hypothetical protein